MKSDVRSGNGAAGLGVDHPGVADHLRVDVPVGRHQAADQLQAGIQLLLRPAGQVAVEPADARGIGNQAVLSLDAPARAPFAEPAHERVGNLARQGFPGLVVLVRENFVELGNAEMGQVDQAGRVVDDQADGHAAARVDDRDTRGRLRRPCAGRLCLRGSAVIKKAAGGEQPRREAWPVVRKKWRRLADGITTSKLLSDGKFSRRMITP